MAQKKTTGIASVADGRTDVWRVDPRKLNIKPNWNSRDFNDPANIEHVDTIAQSACQIGIKKPLMVYWEDGKVWVSDGECRYRAVMRAIEHYKCADIKTVPVITEDRYANDADRLFNQFIHNTGKQFSDIELSNHFKRLLGLGWQAKDIALKAGLSAARISQILNLQKLPEGMKAEIVAGNVSPSLAVAMVKEHGSNAEVELQKGIVAAKAEGSTKVMPRHLGEAAPTNITNVKKLVQECFEYSDFDDDDEDMCVIKMPREWWLKLREICEL